MTRVILQINNDIKNSTLNIYLRWIKMNNIEEKNFTWKGLTVEKRDLFFRGKYIGNVSIFR